MPFLQSLTSGFESQISNEAVDTLTNEIAGIFSSDRPAQEKLDDRVTDIPNLQYPIDLSDEKEYPSKIQFMAKKYEGSKTSSTADATKKDFLVDSTITTVTSVISLYHPHDIQIKYNNEWGTEELGVAGQVLKENPNIFDSTSTEGMNKSISDFVGAASGKLSKKSVQIIGDQIGVNASGAVGKALGVAENPRLSLLFKGVSPRDFQFTFQFAPRSPKEALLVIGIMKAFRYYSAPDYATKINESESFFKYPHIWDIKLLHNNKINKALFPYGPSACTGIDYNYTPQAVWQTFRDGFPVVVDMTLSFQELDIITKSTIKNEFIGL